MKVFHPENNSRDYTGHGPMHFHGLGSSYRQKRTRDKVGRGVMGKEMRERRRRKTEHQITWMICD